MQRHLERAGAACSLHITWPEKDNGMKAEGKDMVGISSGKGGLKPLWNGLVPPAHFIVLEKFR